VSLSAAINYSFLFVVKGFELLVEYKQGWAVFKLNLFEIHFVFSDENTFLFVF